MTGLHTEDEALQALCDTCDVMLKGGHGDGPLVTDILVHAGTKHVMADQWIPDGTKHGSGCTLSSAIIAYLARGLDLVSACHEARQYTRIFLSSTTSLMGLHDHA